MSTFNSNNPVDPLKLLQVAYRDRETDRNPFNYCTSSGEVLETLEEGCTHITISNGSTELIFPRAVPTNYRSKRGSGPPYPLDAICYLLERKDDAYTTYLQEVRRLGFTVVTLPDKKELLEYITSPVADAEYAAVDTEAELVVPLMLFPDSPEAVREQEQKAAVAAVSTSSKKKRPASVEDKHESIDAELATAVPKGSSVKSSLVRPVQTTATLFHCDKDFSALNETFKYYMNTIASKQSSSDPANKKTANASLLDQISSMNTTSSSKSSSKSSVVWIIILPAGSSALLTLHNAKEFLLESKYVPVSEARNRGPKPSSIRFEHSGHHFELVDNPARLALADWSRVLACFTLTSTWQFKGWKWETPLELFQHIQGFHVYFDDVAIDPTVAGWNVTRLAISRNKRHLDATAVMTFWNRITEALKARK